MIIAISLLAGFAISSNQLSQAFTRGLVDAYVMRSTTQPLQFYLALMPKLTLIFIIIFYIFNTLSPKIFTQKEISDKFLTQHKWTYCIFLLSFFGAFGFQLSKAHYGLLIILFLMLNSYLIIKIQKKDTDINFFHSLYCRDVLCMLLDCL